MIVAPLPDETLETSIRRVNRLAVAMGMPGADEAWIRMVLAGVGTPDSRCSGEAAVDDQRGRADGQGRPAS